MGKIKFHLKINSGDWIHYIRKPYHKHKLKGCIGTHCPECEIEFTTDNGRTVPKDMLVHLPGGMLGTQAFYVIIENIMRNSAKYSKKSEEYNLCIEITENNSLSYKVEIFDNFSTNRDNLKLGRGDETGDLLKLLEEKLKTPILKETGEITEKDWGIQEIKIAAQYLNYPFKENKIGVKLNGGKKYIWVATKHPPDDPKLNLPKKDLVSYVFSIPKARLVMCVDYPGNDLLEEYDSPKKGVLCAGLGDFHKKLESSNVEMLYFEIDGNEADSKKKFLPILEKIKEYNNFLPTRIIVAAPAQSIKLLETTILETIQKNGKDPERDLHLPPRRLVICPLNEVKLKDVTKSKEEEQANDEEQLKRKREASLESFIINIYKQWVFRQYKTALMSSPDSYKDVGIVIYFERGTDFGGFKRWRKLKHDISEKYSQLGNIKFCFYDGDGEEVDGSDFNKSSQGRPDVLLGFDNHRSLINKTDFEISDFSFYQIIGKDGNLKMNNHSGLNILQDVPSGFSGAMFILSLIESAFTKVAVVDERVANWAFKEKNKEIKFTNSEDIHTGIIKANLFISARIHADGEPFQLTCKEIDKKEFKVQGETEDILEGISETESRFLYNSKTIKQIDDLDCFVIHLGFLEEISESTDKKINIKDWLKKVRKRIPKIVMVSGRGYKPEEVPLNLPFREASMITNYISTDFCKLNLVKGLMASRGKMENQNETTK